MATKPVSHYDLLILLEGSFRIVFNTNEPTIVILYGYKTSIKDVPVDQACQTYLNNNRRFIGCSNPTLHWLSSGYLRGYLQRQLVLARKRKLKLLISK
jgi:hypothetical protein